MNLKEKWQRLLPKVRKMALSLPMAILAAMLLVGINETGYLRSQDAVDQMAQAQSTRGSVNELLQNMVDAETGQRGYLLTGNESYLEPYDKAVTTVQAHMNALRSEFNGAEAEVRCCHG